MWKQLLSEIKKIEEKYGDTLNKSASNEQIDNFEKIVQEKFNYVLPEQYIAFLKTVNGLEFNGFTFYGVDSTMLDNDDQSAYGFIDSNEIWYENEHHRQYLFFGDSNLSWYCMDLTKGIYVELDKPSGTLINSYSDFNAMLEKALKDSLS